MGCWSETCGVTQLPINYGDKIRAFVLVNQESDTRHRTGGTSYCNEIWAPLGSPIEGTYDDYGCIENIVHNKQTENLLAKLKEHWVPIKDEDQEYEDIPSLDEMDLEKVLYCIEREYARYNHLGEKDLGLFFVLEDVYQTMIAYNPVETESIEQGHYMYLPYHNVIQGQVKKWYTEVSETYQEALKSVKDESDRFSAEFRLNMSDSVFFWDYRDLNRQDHKRLMTELVRKNVPWTAPEVQETMKTMLEGIKFSNSMRAARKFWSPQSGKGSQQNELNIYKMLNKTTDKLIKTREKESEEEGGEVTDKNGYYPYMLAHNLVEEKYLSKKKKSKK